MRFAAALILTLFVFAGCEQKAGDKTDNVELAQRRAKLGEYKPAIRAYEAALDGTAKTADIHYRIALLYDDKLKSPLDAIHHYDRYLELAPSGPHATDAKNARRECEKGLQSKLNREGFMPQSEAAKLKMDNELLRQERTRLEGILEKNNITYKVVKLRPFSAEENAKNNLPRGTREYKVKKGDTLASIAQTFYKNRALSGHIKDANQIQLKGKDIIREGQILIIPEAPSR
jgi:nucleoid-associated protein YgaU